MDVAKALNAFITEQRAGVEIYRLGDSVRGDFIKGDDFSSLDWTSVYHRDAAYTIQYAGKHYAIFPPGGDKDRRLKEGLPWLDPLADVLGIGVLTSAWRFGDGSSHPYDVAEAIDTGKYRIAATDGSTVTLAMEGTDEIVLDSRYGYAVKRRRWHWDEGRSRKCAIENSDWKQFSDGTWFPSTSRIRFYEPASTTPDQPFLTAEMSFTALRPTRESDFDLVADKPGWVVEVFGDGAPTIGVVKKDKTYDLADVASGKIKFTTSSREYRLEAMQLVVWINCGLIFCVVAFELWRRSRKHDDDSIDHANGDGDGVATKSSSE